MSYIIYGYSCHAYHHDLPMHAITINNHADEQMNHIMKKQDLYKAGSMPLLY